MGRTALLACPEGGTSPPAMTGLDRSSFNTEPGLRSISFSRQDHPGPALFGRALFLRFLQIVSFRFRQNVLYLDRCMRERTQNSVENRQMGRDVSCYERWFSESGGPLARAAGGGLRL